MTEVQAIDALVKRAIGEIGYREGSNNWNKYAADERVCRLYGWNVQNQPWCCVFVNYCFIESFGYEQGTAMTYGGSAACAISAQLYQNNGAWSNEPKKGDQVFFCVGNGINHTGIVIDVSRTTITTVEGNSSDMVYRHNYYQNDASIAGYGRPNWSVVSEETAPSEDVKTEMPTLKFGDKGYTVKVAQAILIANGYSCGVDGADGDFGSNTMSAVRKYQIDHSVDSDGIIGNDTWKRLLWG